MKTYRILITGVGGPTPRSFAIALKKYSAFAMYHLVGTDSNPLAVGLYQPELFDEVFLVPGADDSRYWTAISKIIKDRQIDFAVILPEAEVMEWSRRFDEMNLPCKTLIPQLPLTKVLTDKESMTGVLSDTDLVPKSICFNPELIDWNKIERVLGLPFWVRSTSGTSGLGSLKLDSIDRLQSWMFMNPGVKRYIASEYLPGRNLACKLLYFKGNLIRAACGERVNYIMSKVAPSGVTGNTSFGRLLNEPNLVLTATKAMDIMFDRLKVEKHGFFTVDFKENKSGRPLITEVNVRHVAFTQCFAAAGANLAEDTIRLLSDDPGYDRSFKEYRFEEGLAFLRDVDSPPVLLKESSLLSLNKM